MTEAEWLACKEPKRILEFLGEKIGDRKLWLAKVACSRSVWKLFSDRRCCRVVEIVERCADGQTTDNEREAGEELSVLFTQDVRAEASSETANAVLAASFAIAPLDRYGSRLSTVVSTATSAAKALGSRGDLTQAQLLRDIFGNPFHPVLFDPAWRTSTVTSLANAISDERTFDRLPILADALEDAGCTDADVLGHCRGGGEHVRGCWVVDLMLGKE